MAVKKSNVIPINWTTKNIMFFQNLGYLNKKKKSTGKLNLTEFVNRCVDRIISIDWPELDEDVEEKLLIMKLHDLDDKETKFFKLIQNDKREVARKIAELRAVKAFKKTSSEAKEVLQVLEVNDY